MTTDPPARRRDPLDRDDAHLGATGSLRILYVCRGHPERRTGSGERMRIQLAALRRLGAVDVVALDAGEPEPSSSVRTVPVLQRRLRLSDRFFAALGRRQRRLSAACLPEQRRLLDPIVQEHAYDFLWAYSDHAYLALPTVTRKVPTIVDLVDFEDERNVELARHDARWGRGARVLLAKAEVRALKRDLARIASSVDLAVISSEVDRKRLGLSSVKVLPNGYWLEGPSRGADDAPSRPSVLYAGSFNYGPNLDGLSWLLSEIWPVVRQRSPEAELRLVGRGIPPGAIHNVPGVRDLGRIPDMAPELSRASAIVVPLRSGSGTRVKILEAWAHRVPVVSTTIGVAGLAGRTGQHLMVADSPSEIADALIRVSTDRALRARLTANGHLHYREHFSAEAIEDRIAAIVENLLVATRSPSGTGSN